MRHALAVLAVLLPLLSPAATISSTSCTSPDLSGCVTLSMVTYPSTVSAVAVQVTGTWVGTIEFQGSVDGTNYTTLRGYPVGGGSYAPSATANGAWTVATGGMLYFRARATSWTSGTATVSLNVTSSPFMPDVVRAVGSTFGEVQVSGTVEANLTSSTLAALDPAFTYPDLPPAPTLTTTVTTLDDPTISNRTELTIRSLTNGNLNVWCCRGASCTPTSTAAYYLLPRDALKFDNIRDSDTIRCRAATDPVQVNYVEVSQ